MRAPNVSRQRLVTARARRDTTAAPARPIAAEATLAAGANTAFGHYADAYAAHVAACGASARRSGAATTVHLVRGDFTRALPAELVAAHRWLDEARAVARRQLDLFPNPWPVIVPSGSCAAMMCHHYPKLFADDPRMPAAMMVAAAAPAAAALVCRRPSLPRPSRPPRSRPRSRTRRRRT